MQRKGASSHRTKSSKETLNINQKIKKKRLKKTRNNNLLMINNKLILYKNEAKGFWNTYEIRKRIKDVKMKKEIDFEHLESEILEMEKMLWQKLNLNLLLHNQLIKIIFQTKMTQNLKKMKTTQEVRYHKGNIWLIKHKKYG